MRLSPIPTSPVHLSFLAALAFLTPSTLPAQGIEALSPAVREYVSVPETLVALTNVRLVDGTGAPPREGQTIVLRAGRIEEVGRTGEVSIPAGARVLDLPGHTVIPGMVGMHNHTYYSFGPRSVQMSYTGPRLYLAGGVTTVRTAGAQHPYAELSMKRGVEEGLVPGPRVHASGPYFTGPAGPASSSSSLMSEEDARRVVRYWAEEGATWLKASGSISRAVLGAAIDEANRQGIHFTGHLCSVTFREAAALGIHNLEHGLITNSDHIPDKEPDICPPDNMVRQVEVDVFGEEVRETFRTLVEHGVAVTSTLSVYELFVPERAPLDPRVMSALAPEAREELERFRTELAAWSLGLVVPTLLFEKMLQWDHEFVRHGGHLVAGVDPWGNGSLPGYGDQRNYELLVEAGFSPEEAIRIMTLNGAKLLKEDHLYGSVEVGKWADLAVIDGDPVTTPSDIRKMVLVFREGVGYDPTRLEASVQGQVGIR